ncbi:MAG: phosphomannose isomerase type II C-terminal cupin domain [bacterium]
MTTQFTIENPPKSYKEKRPWGDFVKFVENLPCTVKTITVNSGQAFSLQYHDSRDEFWYILSGNGIATVGEEKIEIKAGLELFIPRKMLHRIEAGDENVTFLEIAYGTFDEEDIVRIEDKYNRVK